MKVLKKILLITLFLVLFMIILQINTYAKSYSIDNMDIQATVLENGDVNIKQSITYNFDGDYNGIYISIPYTIDDIEHDEIINNKKINDDLYTGYGITINSIKDGKNQDYIKTSYASNGKKGVYTIEREPGIQTVKVYSPSSYETKEFILDYTIKNLCVKHKDVGELYYNFIGGEWDVNIKNLNIDVYLPNNREEIYIWAHGPLNGISRIISNQHANFKVDNVRKGQYVAARLIFNNSNISSSTKLSNINAKDIIFQDENEIAENKQEKEKFTQKIIVFASLLVIYWVILLIIFEKEKKFEVSDINEEELFRKYNPLIAGCIQGSREILARDIIAVILNLIEKKNINLELIQILKGKDEYVYSISKNKDKENDMDEIERFVYNWIFEKESTSINLQDRLENIAKEKDSNIKFKTLNNIAKRTTNKIGANNAKVPIYLRILNVGLLIIAIITVVNHILFNGFDVYTSNLSVFSVLFMNIIFFLPVLFYLAYIPIRILIFIRHRVNNTIQKFTGQKIVTTSISIILIILAIIVLTLVFSPAKYLIADEMLIGIAILIVLTDNLMLKNNDEILEDYARLNLLKDKLDDYSLLEEKDIEYLELWDKYLCYAVSFGIGEKIIKRLKGLYIDDDLMKLVESSKMSDYISNDFYIFYTYTSLSHRFIKGYENAIKKAASSSGGSGSEHGGGLSCGGGCSGGGGRGRWRRCFLK